MAINVFKNIQSKQNGVSLGDLLYTNSTSAEDTGEHDGWFWREKRTPVYCGSVTWSKIEFFDENGSIVGTIFYSGGSTSGSFSGSYCYAVTSSGSTPPRYLDSVQCSNDGCSVFCSESSDPCKGC